MKITVNGNEVELAAPVSVRELLTTQKVSMPQYVSVQLNDQFVAAQDFDTTNVQDGDAVEFLYFMGGGR